MEEAAVKADATAEAFADIPAEKAGVASEASVKGAAEVQPVGEVFADPTDDATKSDGDKAAGPEKGGEDAAPVEYEAFKMPEGYRAGEGSEARMVSFIAEAHAEKLTQEQAQLRLNSLLRWKGDLERNAHSYWQAKNAEWTAAAKAAGLLTPETMKLCRAGLRGLDPTGSFARELSVVHMDKHPVILSVFSAFGKTVSSPSSIPTSGVHGTDKKPAADILYPNQGRV